MNYSAVSYIIGAVIRVEAVLLLAPLLISAIYRESSGWAFLITACICVVVGTVFRMFGDKTRKFYAREGFVIVALSWLVMSCLGALPFVISGQIPNYIDALFETISGFTTTGASILSDVESLDHAMLFWRSFTHWIGGMGILVFMLAVLPSTGGYNVHLMRAESPGPQVDKLVPRIRQTAVILYGIYLVMTVFEVIALLLGGMTLFDAMTTSFATAGTGGFGIYNDSIGGYSAAIQWIVAIFMVLFGVNFNVYYLLWDRKLHQALRSEEVKVYLAIIALTTAMIVLNTRSLYTSIGTGIRDAFFQVASIITTTGFSTTDFDAWPELSKCVLVILMFIGACASSTGGGMKVSRIIIAFKLVAKELRVFVHPRSIKSIRIDGRVVDEDVKTSVGGYFMLYAILFALSVLIVSDDNFDFATNFTAVAATINNIGPGLSQVGPTCNFGDFSIVSKITLMFDMLAGRLELFPILVLLTPSSWKR